MEATLIFNIPLNSMTQSINHFIFLVGSTGAAICLIRIWLPVGGALTDTTLISTGDASSLLNKLYD